MLLLEVLVLELLTVDGFATGAIAGREVASLDHEPLPEVSLSAASPERSVLAYPLMTRWKVLPL